MNNQINNNFNIFLITIIVVLISSCNQQDDDLGEFIEVSNKLSIDNPNIEWLIEMDSLKIILGPPTPTYMEIYYDTIIPMRTNECDFIFISYRNSLRELKMTHCRFFNYSNIHFEKISFYKGDKLKISLHDCNNPFSSCELVIK